jgi:hypothetical protein
MAGLDPAIHRASVRERWSFFGALTRTGWMAATRAAMTMWGKAIRHEAISL